MPFNPLVLQKSLKYQGQIGSSISETAIARYKHIDTSLRFLAVDLQHQILPGIIEHALNHLLDHEIDLSGFDARFCNDETGAATYMPWSRKNCQKAHADSP